ncbi:NRPS [Arthroderma sp. PD_2]|nr:NRPS [Arthroderma sp. PD_2]
MSASSIFRDTMDAEDLTQIAEACSVPESQVEDVYPCTFLQSNCLAESSIRSGASIYHFTLSLAPSVDLDLLCASLQRVVSLNSILRTRIVDSHLGLVQVVTTGDHCTQRLSGDITEHIKDEKACLLNLGEPLFRSAIINRKLVLTMHHAVMDATSRFHLLDDMMCIYHGHEPKMRAPFKDFVAHCAKIDEPSARSFWASRFKGVPAIYPQVEPGYVPLASQQIVRMIEFSRINADISPAHVPSYMEAAWSLLLGAYTGSKNVAYGLTLSGRTPALDGAETTMGPTMAIVPVQTKLQPSMSIQDLLKERSTALRQLQTHPALQYNTTKIAEVSEAARVASGFQALLNMFPHMSELDGPDIVSYEDADDPTMSFSICLGCMFMSQGIVIKATFDPAVICEAQLRRLLRQFDHTLQVLMEADLQTRIEMLPLLNRDERAEIARWNDNAVVTTEKCLHDIFSEQVKERPTAAAVEASDGRLTYIELDNLSNRLAHELRRQSVTLNCPVAFIFEKSMWAIVAILAILKTGGVCVPIDSSHPQARKKALISTVKARTILVSSSEAARSIDLAPGILVVSKTTIAELPDEAQSVINIRKTSPEDLAFIVFTSGSTGAPKGVMLEHRCLASSICSIAKQLGWQPGFRMLQFASHIWDISIGEIFGALTIGGCLYIPSEEARVTSLAHFIQCNRIDQAWLTPTVIRTLSPDDVPGLKWLISVGEPVSATAFNTWGEALRMINGWGPCESSILSAAAELTAASRYSQTIGVPLNCAIWLVNPENVDELVPIGAVGELLVEGPGVARGYLDDPVKTAAAFVSQPRWAASDKYKGRYYRTGDLGKYNPDGSICFLGRRDNQVKVRGQRFELSELETILASCTETRDVFSSTTIYKGRTELVAVVCLRDPALPREKVLQELSSPHTELVARYLSTIRSFADTRLPSYMIPTMWVAVERMPLTSSAKLDRAVVSEWLKTKDLSSTRTAIAATPVDMALMPPRTDQERLLQSIWALVLDIPKETIGRESCFVQLGGDSMLAMQVASRCQKHSLPITTAALLEKQSLAAVVKLSLSTGVSYNGDMAPKLVPQGGALDADSNRVSQLSPKTTHIRNESVESIAPSTDAQSIMLSIGQPGVNGFVGFHASFTLQFTPALDTAELRAACKKVLKHHPILRTLFVQQGPLLFQVVLKDSHVEAVVEEKENQVPAGTFHKGSTLARFRLFSDGQSCDRLRLEIHHALYDAISMSLVFRDLDAAYTGRPLSEGPHYHSWISYQTSLDGTASRQFWIEALENSSITSLAPPQPMPTWYNLLEGYLEVCVPSKSIQTSFGTPSSVMKAIWALVLSNAVGTNDVVFGEVSANRYLMMPGIDKVRGPCINFLPVRASLDLEMTLASLIAQLQDHETASVPYHHLGFRSIVRDCTPWPRWAKLSSTIVYQNHRSLDASIKIGDADGALSIDGQAAGSADLMIVVTPGPEDLHIKLHFDNEIIPAEQMIWVSRSMTMLLNMVPSSLNRTLGQLRDSIRETVGSYVMPPVPSSSKRSGHQHRPSPSIEARGIAWQAWKELKLLAANQDEDSSMFSDNADAVSFLLLSEYYRSCGYDISTQELFQNPSRLMQAHLIDLKGAGTQDVPNGANI